MFLICLKFFPDMHFFIILAYLNIVLTGLQQVVLDVDTELYWAHTEQWILCPGVTLSNRYSQ